MRIVVIAAAVLLASPALAVDDPAPKPAKEKKICRTSERTGTRFASASVCKTAAEWDRDRRSAQTDIELRQRYDYNASEVNGAGQPR